MPSTAALPAVAMCGAEAGAEHAEIGQVRRQRSTVPAMAEVGLTLGLRQMHLDADLVLAREVTAGDEELVAAMQRDRRAEGRANLLAIERPRAEHVATDGDVLLPRCRAQ